MVTCTHCGRGIEYDSTDGWVDPEASGDDRIWRDVCDSHDSALAHHEPHQAGLGVGHIWTNVKCPAYATTNPHTCTC